MQQTMNFRGMQPMYQQEVQGDGIPMFDFCALSSVFFPSSSISCSCYKHFSPLLVFRLIRQHSQQSGDNEF